MTTTVVEGVTFGQCWQLRQGFSKQGRVKVICTDRVMPYLMASSLWVNITRGRGMDNNEG